MSHHIFEGYLLSCIKQAHQEEKEHTTTYLREDETTKKLSLEATGYYPLFIKSTYFIMGIRKEIIKSSLAWLEIPKLSIN